jgi:putative ABC transport system permease protein
MEQRKTDPPKLARRLFQWYCGNAHVEDLIGDVDELFHHSLSTNPAWKAKTKYWVHIFSLMFSYAIESRRKRAAHHPYAHTSLNIHMVRNYFLIARRMMDRNKVYTMINVLGLTLGISACIIVYLVVSHELSFDRFHADKERIFRIQTGEEGHPDRLCNCIQAPGYVALRDEFAGAESITGYHDFDAKVTIPEKGTIKNFDRTSARIILTDPAYFQIFQYEWLAGGPDVLAKSMSAVITESRARAYFGQLDPHDIIGRAITYNDSLHVTVGGVVKDWNENSDFTRTEFISFKTIEETFLREVVFLDNWGIIQHSSQSFIKLKEGDIPSEVAVGLQKAVSTKTTDKIVFQLQPLSEIHFNPDDEGNSPLRYQLYVLSALAGFILLIAAINFVNLSTAQSFQRTKEIGIRKVMGSQKFQIVFQFFAETFLMTTIALIFSLLLIEPLLSVFSGYLPSNVHFNFSSINNWLFLITLLFATAFLAGTYPALVVSSRAPALSLGHRNGRTGRDRGTLRKVLIVFQFSMSLFFIIATLVISSQMNFIRTKDRGFSTDRVLTFRTNWAGKVSTVETLAERLRRVPGIEGVSMQSFTPMGFALWQSTFVYDGKKGKVEGLASVKVGDEHYIPLYKIRLIAGSNVKPTDSISTDVVVNESFIKTLGISSPHDALGEQFTLNDRRLSIHGVVQDFHENSFRHAIGPCIIMNRYSGQHSIAMRLQETDAASTAKTIARVESEFKALYPDETFSAYFIEDEIGLMHGEEQKVSSLATIAMGITIFISCMGIFGLAMYTASMRTREIGIRKVLGASVTAIVSMLSREFMMLVVVSIILTTPIGWYYMNRWLTGFIYRTDLSIWFFIGAAVIALITALLTVSYQSFKAATADPVNAIKSE